MAFNPQLYLLARPDLKNNWDKAHAPDADMNDPIVQWYRQYTAEGKNFNDMLQDDYNNNPTAGDQAQARAQTGAGAGNNAAAGAAAGAGPQVDRIATNPPPTSPPAGGFNNLVTTNQVTPNVVVPPPNPATVNQVAGANYNQNQAGTQTGGFNTVNNTSNTGGTDRLATGVNTSGTTTNNRTNTGTTNTTTGQSNTSNTGSQTNNTTGTVNQTNQNRVIDTLGFGDLLKGQAATVGANDASRSAFLRDTMETGGSGFNSQVDKSVRQSLSGPGMTGAGESASARAAGYAASDVARNNLNQRLAASQQLAGPTGLASLSTAANPFLGSESSTQGKSTGTGTVSSSNTGTTSNTGTSQGTGFEDLLGNSSNVSTTQLRDTANNWLNGQENTSGTAVGNSSTAASGLVPEAKQVSSGGGGCVLCTAGIELGQWRNVRVLRKVIKYKVQTDWVRFSNAARGYFFAFSPVANWLLRHRRISAAIQPALRAIVYEELRVAGENLPFKVWPWTLHWLGHGLCATIGRFPVPGYVTDKTILDVAKKHNVLFQVGGVK